jgi:hypothetical protein
MSVYFKCDARRRHARRPLPREDSASPASRAARQNLANFTGTLYPPIGGSRHDASVHGRVEYASGTLMAVFRPLACSTRWRLIDIGFSKSIPKAELLGRVRRFRADAGVLPYSAFTSSNSTILVAPVIGTITPGDLTIILLPSTRMKYTRSVS